MMKRSMIVVAALLLPAIGLAATWAVEPGERSKDAEDQQARQREGGRSVAKEARKGGTQEKGTEEGLPEARIESFDAQERFRVRPPWRLGVYAYNTPAGVVISRVMPGSAAWRAGLEPGDRIVTIGGYQVGIIGDRVYYLGEELQLRTDARGNVLLLVQNVRNNQLLTINVRLQSHRLREPVVPMPRDRRGGATPQ